MRNWMTFLAAFLLVTALTTQPAEAEEAFRDLDQTPWAKEEITYLSNEGIINGYGNGYFGPKDPITRAQAAMMLVNDLYPNAEAQEDPGFHDLSRDSIYYNAIAVAAQKGLVSGYPDGTYKPDANIKRD